MNKLQQKLVAGCGIAVVILGGSSIALGNHSSIQSLHSSPNPIEHVQNENPENSRPNDEPKVSSPIIETKTETKTRELPFETKYIDDNTITKGATKVTQNGTKGIETTTYSVTYTDGVETARETTKVEVTKKPVDQIISRGTYVAPKTTTTTTSKPTATPTKTTTTQNCTNGTYVNSAGNTVCRPVQSATRPSGATARCKDGSYSYSQSRRGTCSHHGGVAQWL